MRILYVCHNLATFILSEAAQMKREGHDVFILGENSSKIFKVINKPMLVKHGLDENFYGFSLVNGRLQKYWKFSWSLLYDFLVHPIYTGKACIFLMIDYKHPGYGILDYLDARKFFGAGINLIHSPFSVPSIIAKVFLLSKILNVPYTLSFKAHDIWQGENLIATKTKVRELGEASKLFTIATFNKIYLQDQLDTGKDIEVIHDAIDVEFFKPTYVKRSPNSIISVSRLSPEKGLIYLLRACHILHQRQIAYHCTIVGDGPEKHKYEKLIDELKIPNIYLAGFLSYDQVKEHLESHAIFVLPSIIDSDGLGDILPNGVKEAMAMQIPVITSNIRGIDELVVDGVNGMLVPQGKAEAIADAIELLIRRPDFARKMGEEGRRKIEKDFNLKTEVGKIERIFQQAIHH